MNKQTITIPRGQNVGNTIKDTLIEQGRYSKGRLFVHSLTRNIEQKTIIAIISYTCF